MTITEHDRHAARMARDPGWDGRFVYGVVTTGVYCRPSCPARTPRPENVRYFDGPGEAAAAGYRPCKRCRPDEPMAGHAGLVRVARYLEASSAQRLTLSELADGTRWSPARLQRAFKAAFGVTPRQYQDQLRLKEFKTSLKAGDGVAEAIFAAGYGSTSRIYGEASRNIGMSPSAYRAGGAGEHIAWAWAETGLGPLLMAATDRGVCFAEFGASVESLQRQLQQEFPAAQIAASPATGTAALTAWTSALAAHLNAGAPRPELPLDLRGTALQIKVWRFLMGTRAGEVHSYGEVAAAIEHPRAVRAVASACGRNRIAVLVPCHRVLRGDGSLGGYRWGTARKRALLDAERTRTSS